MTRARRLMLLAVLSLAAGALAATPAVAATVTQTPHSFPITVTGTSTNASLAGPITMTCQSTANATIANTGGAGTLDSLNFVNCTPSGCVVNAVTGADAVNFTVTAVAGPVTLGTNGTVTTTDPTHNANNTRIPGDTGATQTGTVTMDATGIEANVTCVLTCTFTPGTVNLAANESNQTLTATNVPLASTTFFCGSATWTATYGLGSPANGLTLDS
jgi:hypothetical protein